MSEDAPGLMEDRLAAAGFSCVAGADEVGRGALAGPLFAAAVILPEDARLEGLRDSKLCTRLQRERLAEKIKELAVSYAIVRARPSHIDKVGLQRTNREVLRRALRTLSRTPDYVLVDFMRMRRLPYPGIIVKKADAVSRNVAAASILAKVHRDRVMRRYHRKFPQYGFASNVGYGTRYHWNALKTHGPSAIHRRSFFGVLGFPDEHGVLVPHQARHLEEPGEPGPALEVEES